MLRREEWIRTLGLVVLLVGAATVSAQTKESSGDVARRFLETAWNGGDLKGASDLYGPQVVVHSSDKRQSVGIEHVQEMVASVRHGISDPRVTLDEGVDAGDTVIHRFRMEGTSAGKPIALSGTMIVRVEKGKVVECWTRLDAPETMPQGASSGASEGCCAPLGAEDKSAPAGSIPVPRTDANPAPQPSRALNIFCLRAIKAPFGRPRANPETFWTREFMTGNWGGLRDRMIEKGIELNIASFIEPYAVLDGGLEEDSATHTVSLGSLDLYTQKMGLYAGGQVHLTTGWLTGSHLRDSIGSLNANVQTEAQPALTLFEAWYGQHFGPSMQHELRVGKIFPWVRFGACRSACLFNNGAFNYPTFLGFGMNATYFAAPFSVQYAYTPTPDWILLFQAADGIEDESGGQEKHRSGTVVELTSTEGCEFFGELDYKLNQRPTDIGLPGNYKFGVQYHTGEFKDRFLNEDLMSRALFGGSPATERGDHSMFLIMEQMVCREADEGPGKSQGLWAFVKTGLAPDDVNLISFHVACGVNYRGLIPGRDHDSIGFGYSREQYSRDERRFQRDRQTLDPSVAVPHAEEVIEASYSAEITPWWIILVDVQHIINPGGLDDTPDATIFGGSIRFSF